MSSVSTRTGPAGARSLACSMPGPPTPSTAIPPPCEVRTRSTFATRSAAHKHTPHTTKTSRTPNDPAHAVAVVNRMTSRAALRPPGLGRAAPPFPALLRGVRVPGTPAPAAGNSAPAHTPTGATLSGVPCRWAHHPHPGAARWRLHQHERTGPGRRPASGGRGRLERAGRPRRRDGVHGFRAPRPQGRLWRSPQPRRT